MRRAWFFAAGGAALALAGAAFATELSDPVPGHPGLTYFALAKLAIPDLTLTGDGASGHKVAKFRHIEGEDMRADPADDIKLDSASLQVLPIPGQPNRLIVLIDTGGSDGNVEEAVLMGLFALDGARPRLLDLVEVGNDRWTGVDTEHPPQMLAPGAPLIVVSSSHSNSNESYDDTELVFVRNNRFELIDSRFTYNEQNCGYQLTQDAAYTAAPAKGPYADISATITKTVSHDDEDCGEGAKLPTAGPTTYHGVYSWDVAHARYVTHSPALKALDDENDAWLKAP